MTDTARLRTLEECELAGFKISFTGYDNQRCRIEHPDIEEDHGAFITSNVNEDMFGNEFEVSHNITVGYDVPENHKRIEREIYYIKASFDCVVYSEMLDFGNDFLNEKDFEV